MRSARANPPQSGEREDGSRTASQTQVLSLEEIHRGRDLVVDSEPRPAARIKKRDTRPLPSLASSGLRPAPGPHDTIQMPAMSDAEAERLASRTEDGLAEHELRYEEAARAGARPRASTPRDVEGTVESAETVSSEPAFPGAPSDSTRRAPLLPGAVEVRTRNGRMFSFPSMAALREAALHGRVVPTDEVLLPNGAWAAANEVPQLESAFFWRVNLVAGQEAHATDSGQPDSKTQITDAPDPSTLRRKRRREPEAERSAGTGRAWKVALVLLFIALWSLSVWYARDIGTALGLMPEDTAPTAAPSGDGAAEPPTPSEARR
jgi:hypothetical protein